MSSFQQLLSAQAKNHWPRTQGAKPSSADTAATIFFTVRFGAATVQGRPLFKGSIYMYFVQPSSADATPIFFLLFVLVWLLFEGSYYSRAAFISSASMVIVIRNYSHTCACAVYTSRGYCLRAAFISFRAFNYAATIWGWWLFEGGDYLRVATIWGRQLFEKIR